MKMTIEDKDGNPQMHRYTLFKCKWFRIFLHNIVANDADPHHDHPWDFVSFILKGGYFDTNLATPYPTPSNWRKPGSIIRHKAEDAHKIELRNISGGPGTTKEYVPAWSLVIAGRTRREWGFWIQGSATPPPDPMEWIPWSVYMDQKFGKKNWKPI
jgi:hypothetical protein